MPARTRYWLRRNTAAIAIQNKWKAYVAIDPITLDHVNASGAVFKHVDDASYVVTLFDALSLAKNMVVSSDYRNPITRIEFLRPEILRIQHLSIRQGYMCDLMTGIRESLHRRREMSALANLTTFLANEAAEAGRRVVHVVSIPSMPVNWVVTMLQSGLLSHFRNALINLRTIDHDASNDIVQDILNHLPSSSNHNPIVASLVRNYIQMIDYEDDTDMFMHSGYRYSHSNIRMERLLLGIIERS